MYYHFHWISSIFMIRVPTEKLNFIIFFLGNRILYIIEHDFFGSDGYFNHPVHVLEKERFTYKKNKIIKIKNINKYLINKYKKYKKYKKIYRRS